MKVVLKEKSDIKRCIKIMRVNLKVLGEWVNFKECEFQVVKIQLKWECEKTVKDQISASAMFASFEISRLKVAFI